MDLIRTLKHLAHPDWLTRRAFSRRSLQAIEAVITDSERQHCGELRFVVEGGLGVLALRRGSSSRERALDWFSQLRVWDTEHNSGVLIYVQLVDRRVEIVADRGIHRRVGTDQWQHISRQMEMAFKQQQFEAGALAGIAAVSGVLAAHFPPEGDNPDELPNAPTMV